MSDRFYTRCGPTSLGDHTEVIDTTGAIKTFRCHDDDADRVCEALNEKAERGTL